MSAVGLVIDADDAALDVADGFYYRLRALSMPDPELKSVWASSFDTEGSIAADEHGYENREITATILVKAPDEEECRRRIGYIAQKIAKLNREKGGITVIHPGLDEITFDVEAAKGSGPGFDVGYVEYDRAEVEVTFICRPFGRGVEQDKGTFSETTLPALIFAVGDVPGDVDANGRLLVTEVSGNAQWEVDVAAQSRYYSPADGLTTAKLFYQAEDLTPLGTSTDTAGAAGASGTNVIRNTDLTTAWQSILTSEIDSSNLALTHQGSFRVKARIYRPTANTGVVSLRIKWGQGDFRRRTRNEATTYPIDTLEGGFTWVDLGLVHLPEEGQWRFDIEARSTVAGDEIDLDCFVLFPTAEGYIELSAVDQIDDPITKSAGTAVDDATLGTVTWSNPGNVTSNDSDYAEAVPGPSAVTHYLKATNFGFAIPASAVVRGIVVEIEGANQGAGVLWDNAVRIVKGGAIQSTDRSNTAAAWAPIDTVRTYGSQTDLWGTAWLASDINASTFGVAISIKNLNAGTGGPVDIDHIRITVYYTEIPDAAVFASRSLELRHDGADRYDSTGAFLSQVSERRGRYLRIPPSGREDRETRIIVKGYRNDPETMTDPGIDDIQAQLFVTPRYLSVPEP